MPSPDPTDDRAHRPTEAPRWRESYYFSFFDFEHGIGGFSSIGKRPAKGYSGSINTIWGPEIPTLVASERGKFERHEDEFAVAGLEYRKEQELGPWRLLFEGKLNDGGEGRACDLQAVVQSSRFEGRQAEVEYDLRFVPSAGAYLYSERPEWDGLFEGHVDEIGSVEGTLRIDGREYSISGRGSKDHSWGVRDWTKPKEWRWLDVLFEQGPELALWRVTFDGSTWIDDGALFSVAETTALERYEESLRREPIGQMDRPKDFSFRVGGGASAIEAEGEVVRIVPLVFAGGSDGEAMWNDRSLVRCNTVDGRVGWAGAEFQSQVAVGDG